MASADQYAEWIVANESKKGTPEFNTVAEAYKLAREETTPKVEGGQAAITRGVGDLAVNGIDAEPAEPLPEGSALDVVVEPAKAVGSSLLGTVVSGLAGAGAAPVIGAEKATELIGDIQQSAAEFGAPETQRGQAALTTVGDLIEKGVDLARFPISGLAGLAELISGQSVEQAAETVKSVQEKGVGQTAGDRAFEITGDPLISTIAAVSPEIVGSLIPITKIAKTRSALKIKIADQIKASTANPQMGNKIRAISNDMKSGKITPESGSLSLSALEDQIRKQSGSIAANKIREISDDIARGKTGVVNSIDDLVEEVSGAAPQKSLAKYMVDGSGKLKGDKLAQETIKQGFDQGVVSAITGSSKVDKGKMSKMVEVMQKGKENALFATKNRPSDIAGASLLDRVKFIKDVNKKSGAKLNIAAKDLKGKTVDARQPIDNFLNNLDEIGVTIDNKFKPSFFDSDIEFNASSRKAITDMTTLLSRGKIGVRPDAFRLHRMKRAIDEIVTYGKEGVGVKGKTERILKQLRRDLDSTLDDAFPAYNEANTIYADTVGALDALQDVAGRKLDLFGPNADKATGTLLRRMMSNAQSRVNLVDAVDNLDVISKKYGSTFGDDISTQMLFVDELDSVFGPVARTSLAGETAKGFKKGAEAVTGQRTVVGAAIEAGAAGVEKLRGINEEAAFKSINELLKRK